MSRLEWCTGYSAITQNSDNNQQVTEKGKPIKAERFVFKLRKLQPDGELQVNSI